MHTRTLLAGNWISTLTLRLLVDLLIAKCSRTLAGSTFDIAAQMAGRVVATTGGDGLEAQVRIAREPESMVHAQFLEICHRRCAAQTHELRAQVGWGDADLIGKVFEDDPLRKPLF